MRLTFRISLLAIGLASLLGPGAASAGTLVEFPNLPGHTPANLRGYLARPDSGLSAELGGSLNYGAPFPAVVVLHGCAGIFGHSAVIADRLSSWGYVTLAVDSLGPRGVGIANRCGRGLPDQAFDAYAALRYLSQLDFVDPARVAVFGQSMGALGPAYHHVDLATMAPGADQPFAPIRDRRLGTIPVGHLRRIRLDLMAAISAPDERPDASSRRATERLPENRRRSQSHQGYAIEHAPRTGAHPDHPDVNPESGFSTSFVSEFKPGPSGSAGLCSSPSISRSRISIMSNLAGRITPR
jgi:dienelactone hydrolase